MIDIDIRDLLIWAYRDQRVDEVPNGIGGPGVALMRWNMAVDVGDRVDPCHPDAFTVAAAVRSLPRAQAGLVIAAAKTGMDPDWLPGARVVIAAIVNRAGNPSGIYDETRHVIGHRVAPALEMPDGSILYRAGQDYLDGIRVAYSAWRAALVDLVRHLHRSMEEHRATGPAVLDEPWRRGSLQDVA